MNTADPMVPASKSAHRASRHVVLTSVRDEKNLARKMMMKSQTPAQPKSGCDQEVLSTDPEPDVFFTPQLHVSRQACVHALATPVTLPQDHYSQRRAPIPHRSASAAADSDILSDQDSDTSLTMEDNHTKANLFLGLACILTCFIVSTSIPPPQR